MRVMDFGTSRGVILGLLLLLLAACAQQATPTAPVKTTEQKPAATATVAAKPIESPAVAPKPTQGAGQAVDQHQQELARLVEGAKTEGTVVWRDGLKPDEAGPIIEAFQKKYPFIKVDHGRISDTESRERILREFQAGMNNVDVFDVSSELVPALLKAGVFAEYDWTRAFAVRPEQLPADARGLIYVTASVKGIGLNTQLLSEQDAPKTWEGLLDPRWKGKLVVDSRPNTFVHLMPAWGEQKVLDFLKQLAAQQPRFRRGQTESIQLMAAGEFPLIAGTYRHSLLLVKDQGAPLAYVQPDPVPVSLDHYGVAAKAPHPNAARLFLGWLATEGQKVLDDATRRGIPLPGFDTEPARAAQGKQLSLFVGQWVDRSAELQDKAVKALGVD